jgi:probable HAF family extracellular repeat protein
MKTVVAVTEQWNRRWVSRVACIAVVWVSVAPAAGPAYTITGLGDLGGGTSVANRINNSGQVTGRSLLPGGGDYHAFLYSNGQMHDLGTLGGTGSEGVGINSSGQVVGNSTTSDNNGLAFHYSNGQMHDIAALAGVPSLANDINDSGQIVGRANTAYNSGMDYAFLYSGGVVQNLGIFGGSHSDAYAINNNGQVVGSADSSTNFGRAFLFSGGVMTDLGPGVARDINDAGQVVGTIGSHAFLYSGGVMHDLGTFGGPFSGATGINNLGQVVGSAYATSTTGHPFIYNGGSLINLSTLIPAGSGWDLLDPTAINDSGQIVGTGFHIDHWEAFLLTPIPEPAVFSLLALAGVGTLILKRRGVTR